MNTRIEYIYRDASNYQVINEVVVAGTFTEEQIDTIMDCLSEGEYFIPSQVGLPERRFDTITEDDHCWFELNRQGFERSSRPDEGYTVEEILNNFKKMKGKWDDTQFVSD